MKPTYYKIDQYKDTKDWSVVWSFETNGDICWCGRRYKRKSNAMIFLARLKDDQFSMQQQFRWVRERKKKEETGS